MIAAVARNGVIGNGGELPWTLPGELQRFKETTLGHTLVMGRRTFESIGRPLPGRHTVVMSRNEDWDPGFDGVDVVSSIEGALGAAAAAGRGEFFVAGGATIYARFLPLADRLILTWVDLEPDGDTYFPSIDWSDWTETERRAGDGYETVTYLRSPDTGNRQLGRAD